MKNVDELREFSIYSVTIRHYNTGADLAIATLHLKQYDVFERTQELATNKATSEFQREFPGQTIEKLQVSQTIRLEDCLF